jgi:uncharacterized membrane protein (DUF4010 family)
VLVLAGLGFYDDYAKILKQTGGGTPPRVKLITQFTLAGFVAVYLWKLPAVSQLWLTGGKHALTSNLVTDLMLPFYKYPVHVGVALGILVVLLAIVTTSLLYFKSELRGITEKLEGRDLISILQFAVLTFIVLPLLPNRDYGPYAALNPYQIWTIVVLISGVSLAGYIAMRMVGLRYGAPLLGVFGGLVSSTATTLVYARHGREQESMRSTAVTVIVLANLMLLVRLAILTAFISPDILRSLLPVLGGGLLLGLAALAYGNAWRAPGGGSPMPDVKNPTEIRTALTFAAVYAIVLLFAAWLSDIAGTAGLYAVALVSGLTDVDAITLSSLRLFNMGNLASGQVAIAVVLAIIANTVFKLGLVLVVGGRPLFGRCAGNMAPVAIGLVVALLLIK